MSGQAKELNAGIEAALGVVIGIVVFGVVMGTMILATDVNAVSIGAGGLVFGYVAGRAFGPALMRALWRRHERELFGI